MEHKSSNDILQDYFSDMLNDGMHHNDKRSNSEIEPDRTASSKVPVSRRPIKQPPSKIAPRETPSERKQTAMVAQVSKVSIQTEIEYEQKQKLERLLASARSKLELVPEVITEPELNVSADIKKPEIDFQIQSVTEMPIPQAPIVEGDSGGVAKGIETAADENTVVDTDADVEWESEIAEEEQAVAFLEWCDNGRPQWAQERFEVLLFKVSGLTLAVPLIALGQIQPLTEDLTPLFGQAEWFMGLQPAPSGDIRTVNTAMFVMPERYDEAFVDTAKYVVSLNGVSWGLAVDSVNQPISLMIDDVNWRSERSKRPWLAGTVKNHMCALIDIPQMAQMLLDADKAK